MSNINCTGCTEGGYHTEQCTYVPKMARCADCGRPLPDAKKEEGVKHYCGACGQMHGW